VHGVTVNAVCPGPTLTPMISANDKARRDAWAKGRVPLKRYGDPEEVAHAVLNLLLPASRFITGASLVVDGGLSVNFG